jgi:amino acid adenylation domain-containing protein
MPSVKSQLSAEFRKYGDVSAEAVAGVFSGDVFAMPASPAQERFWAFEHAYPGTQVWNVACRWCLRGPLKIDLLGQALNAICARHEALRTCFELRGIELLQKAAAELELRLPVHDLRDLPETEREAEAERITVAEATRPFSLTEGPLLRTRLIKLEDDRHVLLVTVHHAICDGWSIGIISRDLGSYYRALLTQTAANLAELPIQFADYVVWQKEALEKGSFETQSAFWKKQLRSLQPLAIAGDLPQIPGPTWAGKIVSGLLPRSMTDALAQVAQRNGTTMFSAALSALCVLMNGLSGREDIAIGTQVAGRNRIEVENAIGLFNNALVLRTRVPRSSRFSEVLARVSETVIQATANQDLPHERVLQALGSGDLGRDRLYYVNFIYQRSFIENLKFGDIQLIDLPSRTPGAPYDLNFFMVERPEGWRLSLEYNTELYSDGAAERVLGQFRQLMEEVIADPELPVSQFRTVRSIQPTPFVADQRYSKSKPSSAQSASSARPKVDVLASASLAQQRFWLLEQLGQGSSAFNIPIRWLLKGQIKPEVLECAFNELIRRHDILRTTLIQVEGQPMQRIAPFLNISVAVTDLTGLPENERGQEADRLCREHGEQRFELSALPLLRAILIRTGEEEFILHVTVHHIVADGWAVGLFAQEIGDIYDAYVRGLPSPLPDPEMQYADYSAWQRELLQSENIQPQNQFWLERFRNHSPFEVMPDKPRPALQTTNGDVVSIQLPRAITDAIQEVSRKHGNTFFITACAAFLTLLYRYTGQEDITIGTQVSGRNQVEHEQIIGLFLNTLPLRNDLSGNPSFPQLLERVQEVVLQALAHQDTPFENLVELINPKRDLSRNPLFQVNFMLQRSLVTSRDYDTFSLLDVPSRLAGAMYDLNCLMVERPDGWRASIQFNTDLFETGTAARMLRQFETLLGEIGKNAEQRISEFPILLDEERKLLAQWNDKAVSLPQQETVHQLFEVQADRTPKAVAVVCSREECTYSELERRANQLAHYLRGLGVQPGERVGLCVERSVSMMVGLIGILKAGASYIPLDPAYPAARLAQMVDDSQARMLVTQEKLRGTISTGSARVVCLDSESKKISRESSERPCAETTGEHLAYLIYTSGSTGMPKGVQVPHRAVVNLLSSMRGAPGIERADILVAVTTLSFDIAALELFLPLTVGARLVIATREQAADGAELLAVLRRSRATIMQATPTTWQMLLAVGWEGNPRLKMLCGGEALARGLANELLATGGELWNMYGPTETTIWSSVAQVKRGTGPVPIGPPIANTQFHVLDANLQHVPVGAPGELFIGGAGVAHGYYNRPELNRDKFVPDPFSGQVSGQLSLYRSGDMVRWKTNGELEFLGRTDHQVKVRGFRIETGEIEAAIVKHPGVKESAVVAREDGGRSKYLVAYFVPSPVEAGQVPAVSQDLRAALQQQLPEYMQPSAFVSLAVLPRTPNGKVDRNALPPPDLAEIAKASYVAPANETEKRVLAIWEKVLGISTISTNANFFDVGGHSLLAAQLLARIDQSFGKKIPLAALFQSPTIQQMSELLTGQTPSESMDGVATIQPRGSRTPIFCLHGVPSMRLLADELGEDQPFVTVNLPREARLTRPYRVEEIAAIHLKTIQRIQPEGPYFLAGWCREALLAYEIAQRLKAQGKEVGLVMMFDTWVPGYLSRFNGWEARRARSSFEVERILVHARNLKQTSLAGAVRYAWEQLGTIFIDRIRYTRLGLYRLLGFEVGSKNALSTENQDDILLIAVKSYRPKPYDGRVLLFRSDKYRTWRYWDANLGWAHLLPNLKVFAVPGVHDSMLTGPHCPSIARAITEAIDDSVRAAEFVPASETRSWSSFDGGIHSNTPTYV